MLYNIVLVSAMYQHELAIGIRMSPPFGASLPPPTPSHLSRLSQSTRFELPASQNKLPLAVCFTHGHVCVSMLPSRFVLPSPFPTVSTSLNALL